MVRYLSRSSDKISRSPLNLTNIPLDRFAALQVPLEKKKKKVDEKENLREFNKLAGDEEQYLKEKQIALDNNNLGGSLFL